MTADEFEAAYAARSGLTVARLRELGRVVKPCDCGDEICDGWQSVNAADYEEWVAARGVWQLEPHVLTQDEADELTGIRARPSSVIGFDFKRVPPKPT